MSARKGKKEVIRGTVGRKKRIRRKKPGERLVVGKGQVGRIRGIVGAKKRTGRKNLGEQFVERKGPEGINKENSWW